MLKTTHRKTKSNKKGKSTMKHLRNFVKGAETVLVLSPPVDYVRPSKSGFKEDAATLRKDSGIVAKDLKSNVRKYGAK